jgi:hypothetical protein
MHGASVWRAEVRSTEMFPSARAAAVISESIGIPSHL